MSGLWFFSCHAGRLSAALPALMLLGACVSAPELAPPAGLAPTGDWAAARSLAAPARDWPAESWWRAYGDAQLDALIDEAVADAPSLQVAAARLRRAEAGVRIADAARGPQVSGRAAAEMTKQSYNLLVPRQQLPQGWDSYGRATLDFSWELDFWGRNRAALAAATTDLDARRAEFAQSRLMLAAAMASHYAELSRLHASRDTALRALEIRARTASLFTQRFGNGLETRGSLRDADARRAVAEGALLAVEEQIALQRNRIAALLGAGPDRGLAIARPALALDRAFGLPAQLHFDLLGRRPDVTAARLRAEAAARRIDVAEAEFYPNVNLAGFVGLQALGLDRITRNGSEIGSVGPAISLPIFNGGRLKAQYAGRRAEYDEAVADYRATVARALQEVADNAVSQQALGQRLDKADEAVDAATEAHRVARDRYEGGLANALEVLSAEDRLLDSLSARTNLRALSWTLDIDLQRALGGGYRLAAR
ncbi:MAG: efflux transporter outer membrane subunit [Candidatus Dactylopiibacterium sp.]|nr:efflux transporter outer membrane subunit [Candidatus Dactylopiibacterium sp.]